jgi:predicted nucleic acid-binding protein
MATKYPLEQIPKLASRPIFFDANVLLYIFWPTGAYRWETHYSRAFQQLLQQRNPLHTDFIVLSEVLNRAVRNEYEKYLLSNGLDAKTRKYKDFRKSAAGISALDDIHLIIRNDILPRFTCLGKAFGNADIERFLLTTQEDFVDKAISDLCREHGFVLLTNDGDFAPSQVDVLSSNPSLLQG